MSKVDIPEIIKLGKNERNFAVSSRNAFWTEQELIGWMKSKDPLIVAEYKGEIIGFILAAVHHATGKAVLENIFVRSGFRCQGIAGQLLGKCLQKLKKQKVSYVCALARKDNKTILRFSLGCGFEKGHDFVWLEKEMIS